MCTRFARKALRACFALWVSAGIAAAQPPVPLPAEMQEKVNQAIERGVAYLKSQQKQHGSWHEDPKYSHAIGYAALPALTLLECGVPATDPAIQRAAYFVRLVSPSTQQTYDLSLAILFLDRLDHRGDRPLIQMLAARLIAGQAPTGGWGYKCPKVTTEYATLLAVLRDAEPPPIQQLIANQFPDAKTALAGQMPNNTMIGAAQQPDFLKGTSADPETAKLQAEAEKLQNQESRDVPEVSPTPKGFLPAAMEEKSLVPFSSRAFAPRTGCIKSLEEPNSIPGRKRAVKKKYFSIPPQYAMLPVMNEPGRFPLVDPEGKAADVIFNRTDNSNSQFAILALWAARRHDVPMARTLRLILMRYHTSQEARGGWGYRYQYGGADKQTAAMTAVGLLGIAVGHGLIQELQGPGGARLLDNDPRIVKGFVALGRYVGLPTGKWDNSPMANLYFLWSVERVGVLYGLPKIGSKDWYRWGAEILLANQRMDGNWSDGGYHGAHPTLDSSFALLFLKRANLAKDLTATLPFDSAKLSTAIALRSEPDKKPEPIKVESSDNDNTLTTSLASPELRPTFATPSAIPSTPTTPLQTPPSPNIPTVALPSSAPETSPAAVEEGSSKAGWIFLGGIGLAILGVGVTYLMLGGDDDEDAPKRKSRSART